MKIGLIGYGKMGKAIEHLAKERGIDTPVIISPDHSKANLSDQVDVYIDFSTASQVPSSVDFCIQAQIPLVIGTTGWELDDALRSKIDKASSAVLFAPNFSIGVNLFMTLVQKGAAMINHLDDFDIALREIHHTEKIDSPSGTALGLANAITQQTQKKDSVCTSLKGPIKDKELCVSSSRVGSVIGVHDALISSPFDLIEIKHTSMGRASYASGALLAASWILGKKGYYTFEDIMKEKFYA